MSMIDHMHFDDPKADWSTISDNFCLINGDRKRVRFFIKTMHDAKILTERKMRQEVEIKLQTVPTDNLIMPFGKILTDKIRMIGRFLRQH